MNAQPFSFGCISVRFMLFVFLELSHSVAGFDLGPGNEYMAIPRHTTECGGRSHNFSQELDNL